MQKRRKPEAKNQKENPMLSVAKGLGTYFIVTDAAARFIRDTHRLKEFKAWTLTDKKFMRGLKMFDIKDNPWKKEKKNAKKIH